MSTPRPTTRIHPPWAHTLRRLLCVGLWLAAGLPGQAQAQVLSQVLYIQSALTAPGTSPMFPDPASALPVTLPDEWARSRPGLDGPVWYRVEFPRLGTPESDDLMALFIEHVCSNLEVFLNGQLVHNGGRIAEPITNNCNHPQLVALPSALLRPEGNTIDIKVVGYPWPRWVRASAPARCRRWSSAHRPNWRSGRRA